VGLRRSWRNPDTYAVSLIAWKIGDRLRHRDAALLRRRRRYQPDRERTPEIWVINGFCCWHSIGGPVEGAFYPAHFLEEQISSFYGIAASHDGCQATLDARPGEGVDLADGESTTMQGSGAQPYVLKNTGGVYSCSCPAWRNQGSPIERRSCKHLRRLRARSRRSTTPRRA
jgi:hypothetical protein